MEPNISTLAQMGAFCCTAHRETTIYQCKLRTASDLIFATERNTAECYTLVSTGLLLAWGLYWA